MSRRHRAQKREVLPDPKYKDLTVTKFMNYVMYEGKKAVAENIVYGAFDILADKKKDQEPVATFHAALDNVAPAVEVRSRRVGGATHPCAPRDRGAGAAGSAAGDRPPSPAVRACGAWRRAWDGGR